MSGCFCKSLYAFSGEQHQQGLKFEAGELIKITQALPGGWWEGEKDGVTGWFPSSYVQVVEDLIFIACLLPGETTTSGPEETHWLKLSQLHSPIPPDSPQGRNGAQTNYLLDLSVLSDKPDLSPDSLKVSTFLRYPVCQKSVSMSVLPGEEPPQSPLPKDWKTYMSPQGRRYYVNTVSKETTWERPSSVPGTPKTSLRHKNSLPAVNGFHGSGSPLHQMEQSHVLQRKPSTDQQSPVSTSPRKQERETSVTTSGQAMFEQIGYAVLKPPYYNTQNAGTQEQYGSSLLSFSLTPTLSLYFPNMTSLLLQINCVTFPLPLHMAEQQLLKPDEWSYCDYFWADRKDPQGNTSMSGFEVLLQKQLKGKQMQKEMADFMRERIKIEEEYAKNLLKLSQIPLASQEEGTLGEAWAQLKKSMADEAEVHLKFSSKLQSEVEKPLLVFRDNFKKDMKKIDHHITDLRKQLASRYAAVEKARKALADRQKDLEVKTQQLEIKLNTKIEEDIKKARRKSTQAGDDLMRCVDLYNQSQSKWFEEMVTTGLELERLEVERVEVIRKYLCQYTTLRHETDMFNQSTLEPVDKLLQIVDPAKDRELWVKEHKTGEVRPVDMEI
ncbi:hypothetical protein NFI96_021383 [Prochilodus magdalenae]|nr:hypothetical protein NFI96_021383 [Prochilodus magdalenae]